MVNLCYPRARAAANSADVLLGSRYELVDEKRRPSGFTPQEHLISVLPAAIAGVVLVFALVSTALIEFPPEAAATRRAILVLGLLGSLYIALSHLLYLPTRMHRARYAWMNALAMGVGLGLLHLILPAEMDILLGSLLVAATISSATVSERAPTYFLLASSALLTFLIRLPQAPSLRERADQFGMFLIAAIAVETILRLKNLSRRHINRLTIVNEFSRQISSSLDSKQVLTLLNATIQNALEADSYYVGLLEGDEIYLSLLYDDGEYFQDVRVILDGTLSGWVIKNNKELFLPDLRNEVDLPGVKRVLIGKDKTSLSWLGVPVHSGEVLGMLAIAAYRPHAFDRSDLELLANMARHAGLALENAFRHGKVEELSYLDDLTAVYHHGHFLKLLSQLGDDSKNSHQPLSLIMLDVDHFKQYNDSYGHLAGDGVLTALCATIKRYLKRSDIVGRWGGEEFAIALPNTGGAQAQQVADRIRETMSTLEITSYQDKTFPVPTVSQGIAEFPAESEDVMSLIDLADRRLYIAKERGRDQVEPSPGHWDKAGTAHAPAASNPRKASIY